MLLGLRPWPRRWSSAVGIAALVGGLVLLATSTAPEVRALSLQLTGAAWAGLISVQAALLVVVVLLTHRVAGLRNVGLQSSGMWTSVVLMSPIFLLLVEDWRPVSFFPISKLVYVVCYATMISLTEEILCRGLLATVLGGRQHALAAALGSSLMFAALHFPNYVTQEGWRNGSIRVACAVLFPACAVVVRLRSGSLGGPILFHAFDDARMMLTTTAVTGTDAPDRSLRPILFGAILFLAYWVLNRRAILQAAARDLALGTVHGTRR